MRCNKNSKPIRNRTFSPTGSCNRYWKVLSKDNIHNKFKFFPNKWNTDPLEYNPKGSCKPGGLYFTNTKNIFKFLDFGNGVSEVLDFRDDKGKKILYQDPEYDYKFKAKSILIGDKKLYSKQWLKDMVELGAVVKGNEHDIRKAFNIIDDPTFLDFLVSNGFVIMGSGIIYDCIFLRNIPFLKHILESLPDDILDKNLATILETCIDLNSYDCFKFVYNFHAEKICNYTADDLNDAGWFRELFKSAILNDNANVDIVRFMIDKGFDINSKMLTNEYWFKAFRAENFDVAKLLIEKNYDINLIDVDTVKYRLRNYGGKWDVDVRKDIKSIIYKRSWYYKLFKFFKLVG